ncbi:hypothetical protein LguiA_001774 [Lonicera macranthoides]
MGDAGLEGSSTTVLDVGFLLLESQEVVSENLKAFCGYMHFIDSSERLDRGLSIEGDTLVLASKGICLSDEFDKMNDQDCQDQPPVYQNHQVMELPNLSPQSWAYQAQCPITSSAYSSPYETTYEMVPQTPSINPPPPYKPSLEEMLTNYLNRQEESTQLGTDTSYDYSHSLGASQEFFTKPPFIDPYLQQGSSLEGHLLQFISRCIENPIPDSIESNYEDGTLFDPKPLVDFPIDPLKVDTCEPQEVDTSVVFPQDSLVLDQSDQMDPIFPFQPEEIVDLFVDSSEMPLVVDSSEIQEPEIRGPIKSNNDIEVSNDVDVLLDHVANKAQVDHLLLDDSKSNADLHLAMPCFRNICVGQINYVDLDLVVETYPKCTSLTTISRDAPRSLEYANVFTGDDSPITCLVVPLNDTLTFDPWPPPFKCSPVSSYPSHNDCLYSVEMFPAGIEAFPESRIGHAPLIIDFCATLDSNHQSNLSHDLMVAISTDQPPDIWFGLSHYLVTYHLLVLSIIAHIHWVDPQLFRLLIFGKHASFCLGLC